MMCGLVQISNMDGLTINTGAVIAARLLLKMVGAYEGCWWGSCKSD